MKAKILIIEDDVDMARLLSAKFSANGYATLCAYNGDDGMKEVISSRPDLVVLDIMLPAVDGFTICERIRENYFVSLIPIIVITGQASKDFFLKAIKAGADDFVVKPFDFDELLAKVEGLLLRLHQRLGVNPLTRLPGNISIEEEIKKRIARGEVFAFCYFDLDNFKAFNDKYGYNRGDKVISSVSSIIMEAVEHFGERSDFVGHIGGDDFVIVTVPERVDNICRWIVEKFDEIIPFHYNEEDRKRGYIEAFDRVGERRIYPLMTITGVVVTNEWRTFSHHAQVSETVAELKEYAKKIKGSICIKDRRMGDRRMNERRKENIPIEQERRVWVRRVADRRK